jgi:fluoride exporter
VSTSRRRSARSLPLASRDRALHRGPFGQRCNDDSCRRGCPRGDFPLGTFLINVSGALVIGYLSVLFGVDWHDRYGTPLKSGVLTGLLGGYTTFSSMQLGAAELAGKKRSIVALSYLPLSVVVDAFLFTSAHGRRMTRFAVRCLLRRYVAAASESATTLGDKRIDPHSVRAMLSSALFAERRRI